MPTRTSTIPKSTLALALWLKRPTGFTLSCAIPLLAAAATAREMGDLSNFDMTSLYTLQKRAELARIPPASLEDAKTLYRASQELLQAVNYDVEEPCTNELRQSLLKLRNVLDAINERIGIVRLMRARKILPVLVERLQKVVCEVIIKEIHVHIHYHCPLQAQTCVCGCDDDSPPRNNVWQSCPIREKTQESRTDYPPETQPKRTRGKGQNRFLFHRDIPDCPYEFLPDRKSLKHIPTGKTYAFSGEKTINLVNRLTGGMMHDDWHVQLSGDDINHLRSTCRDFLNDCVVREEYTGSANGNRRWSGRVRLKGKND